MNNAIDSCKERLDLIETAVQRPEVNIDFSTSDKYFSDYICKEMKSDLSHKILSGDDNYRRVSSYSAYCKTHKQARN